MLSANDVDWGEVRQSGDGLLGLRFNYGDYTVEVWQVRPSEDSAFYNRRWNVKKNGEMVGQGYCNSTAAAAERIAAVLNVQIVPPAGQAYGYRWIELT